MHNRRYHACRTIGWGGHYTSATGVFFINGQGIQIDPIHHGKGVIKRFSAIGSG